MSKPPAPADREPATRLPGRPRWRPGFLGSLAAAALLEVGLFVAVITFAPKSGVIAAPHPQRVRIALEAPKPPKPKPPAPKPKPPPPKPKPPPPKPKPPPPKPKPPPPKPKPLPPPPPKRLPPPPKPPPPPPPRPVPRPRPRPVLHRVVPQPQPAPQPVAPPAPSPAAVASMVMRYAAMLNATVQSHLAVPEMVRVMHLSGTTTVAIRVAPDGQLLSVSVLHSSGFGVIDRAAVAAVRGTSMPPFPSGMPHHPITFDLKVRLRGS